MTLDEDAVGAVLLLRRVERQLASARKDAARVCQHLGEGPRAQRAAELHGLLAEAWALSGRLAFILAADTRYHEQA